MQTNYAGKPPPKWCEHVKYDADQAILDPSRSKEHALAQNFLIYVGVGDENIKLQGWGNHQYLSDLLVSFKHFTPPKEI